MRSPTQEWWKVVFDASYPRIYKFTDQTIERDVGFLTDALKLRRGMRLLDLCCGYGRLSIPLAQKGLVVTGLDYSPSQLRAARRRAKSTSARVTWIRADARGFRPPRAFDRVINIFTSFGFFATDEENRSVIETMAACLRRGGRLCIDTMNRQFIVKHFQPVMSFPIAGGRVTDTTQLDRRTKRLEVRRVVREKRGTLRYRFSLRLYTPDELSAMAQAAGLVVTDLYGSFDRKPAGSDAPRLILVARKS